MPVASPSQFVQPLRAESIFHQCDSIVFCGPARDMYTLRGSDDVLIDVLPQSLHCQVKPLPPVIIGDVLQ